MIYIDTNTLYYAAGVSQHDGIDVEKLNHTIQKECSLNIIDSFYL